jgi:endoglucanase
MKKFLRVLAIVLVIAGLPFAQTNPLNMTTMEVVKDMGLGINIGNTFDAVIECDKVGGSWDQGCIDWVNGMVTLEESWGTPPITDAIIKGYKAAGIKTVRIPVAWSNKMGSGTIEDNVIACEKGQCITSATQISGDYTINPVLLNRVEEVVGYVLNNGMYAIVNIHWDGGWWEKFPTDSAECMNKYKRIWTQVSDRFKSRSGYLVFESLNEEGVWDDVWYEWRNGDDMTAKARVYGILNAINQEFTKLVRASGGNNADRHLLIAGYATNIDRTIDAMFEMPTDAKNRQAVSVHYYDPFGFTHVGDNCCSDWAPLRMTWGTGTDLESDYNQLNTEMDKMKTNFVDKGVPVIIGEYGYANWNPKLDKGRDNVRRYTLAVAEAALSRNMCPVLWDVQLNPDKGEILYYYNRNSSPPAFVDEQLVTGFKALADNTTFVLENKVSLSNFSVQALHGKRLLINANSPTVVEIYDIKGKKAANFNVSGSQIVNLSLPNGVYFAKTQGVRNMMFVVK